MPTVVGRLNIINVLDELQTRDRLLVQQRCIAQIMRHHNRRIQRAEIERGDRDVVVSPLRLNDRSTLVRLVRATFIALIVSADLPFQQRKHRTYLHDSSWE